MLDINRVYCGDCVEVMKMLDDGCIDLTVTSPPYDNLRTYGGNLEWDFEGVANELWRVTKKGGVVVWVVGDATIKGSETGSSFRQALGFMEIGFNLHDTMIYAKNSYIPLTHNRYEQAFEYMFCFSKGKPKTFNPITIECVRAGQKMARKRTKANGDSAYAMRGNREHTTTKTTKLHPNIFYYAPSKNNVNLEHNAPFPLDLVSDHIQSWSNESDLILDPFAGSGTTGLAAKQLNRNYLLIEKNPSYIPIILERLA